MRISHLAVVFYVDVYMDFGIFMYPYYSNNFLIEWGHTKYAIGIYDICSFLRVCCYAISHCHVILFSKWSLHLFIMQESDNLS